MLPMEEVVSHSDRAQTGRMQEQRGYSVFGKEYEQMLRHDLHAENSIDHQLLRRMVLLDAVSYTHLTLPTTSRV